MDCDVRECDHTTSKLMICHIRKKLTLTMQHFYSARNFYPAVCVRVCGLLNANNTTEKHLYMLLRTSTDKPDPKGYILAYVV
jgi:hypothetical protein